MRIAICDDDAALRKRLREAIRVSGVVHPDTEIADFSDGTALLSSHDKDPFDIIFLDIHMDGISGLDAGQRIRSADRNAIIIFLTNYQQYIFQSFKIETFDYIMKPVDDKAIYEVLNRALKKYKEQHYIVHFKWQGNSYALDANQIIYAEGYSRHVEFVTKDEKYESVDKLSDYERQLAPYGFLRCHQGFLINMIYIKSIEDVFITTIYNQTVQMSTRKKRDCLKAFNTFLSKHRL